MLEALVAHCFQGQSRVDKNVLPNPGQELVKILKETLVV